MGMYLLNAIVIDMSGLEITLMVLRIRSGILLRMAWCAISWSRSRMTEDLVDGLECCRLCCGCHLLSLETIIQFLSLLMFTLLVSISCNEVGVLGLQPIRINL